MAIFIFKIWFWKINFHTSVRTVLQNSKMSTRLKITSKWPMRERSYLNALFAIAGYLKRQFTTLHEEKRFKCKICDKSFSYKHQHIVSIHEAIHNGKRLFKCSICEVTFTTEKALHCSS